MSGETSALVVLRPGPSSAATERPAEAPPEDAAVRAAVSWFARRGFRTGPVVGISFAVTGPEALFHEVFGAQALDADVTELPMDRLDDDVAPHVAAVVRTAPPDFGPGNP